MNAIAAIISHPVRTAWLRTVKNAVEAEEALCDAAIDYARNRCEASRTALLAAAKRATDAEHAAGRALKRWQREERK